MDLSVEGKSERIPSGSHIVQLYNKVAEITGVTARLLEMGLQAHEKCLFAGSPAAVQEMEAALAKADIDVAEAKDAGQLIMLTERESLLVNGRFDPYHLLSTTRPSSPRRCVKGWKAVRISMDMSWLTKEVATPEQILKYEAASDAVFTFQNAPIIALMHYDYAQLPGALSSNCSSSTPSRSSASSSSATPTTSTPSSTCSRFCASTATRTASPPCRTAKAAFIGAAVRGMRSRQFVCVLFLCITQR